MTKAKHTNSNYHLQVFHWLGFGIVISEWPNHDWCGCRTTGLERVPPGLCKLENKGRYQPVTDSVNCYWGGLRTIWILRTWVLTWISNTTITMETQPLFDSIFWFNLTLTIRTLSEEILDKALSLLSYGMWFKGEVFEPEGALIVTVLTGADYGS